MSSKQQQVTNINAEDKDSLIENNDTQTKESQSSKYRFDELTSLQIWGYALGHFYNDLCAACWFNYLVFYLKQIQGISWAPEALLSGQVADALATPLVGTYSDKTNTKYGQRTPWYVGGIILVSLTFIPTFHKNLFVQFGIASPEDTGLLVLYYILFPSLFNVGWASVQVANMSLVPSLTCSRKTRDLLNSRRNTFTFVANLTVLFMALVFFALIKDNTNFCFQLIGYLSTIIGLGTSLFYLIQINEVKMSQVCQQCMAELQRVLLEQKKQSMKEMEEERIRQQSAAGDTLQQMIKDISKQPLGAQAHLLPEAQNPDDLEFEEERFEGDDNTNIRISYRSDMGRRGDDSMKKLSQEMTSWKHWFTQPQFYIFGVVYMACRLYCNVLSTLINFYLIYVLTIATPSEMAGEIPIAIALIPLILFISSVGASTTLSFFYNKFGRKNTFTFGTLLGILSSTILLFLTHDLAWLMYFVALVIGASQSITLNTGIALISEVIGLKGEAGAFVYGCYSFLDKLITGVVLYLITSSHYFEVPDGSNIPKSTSNFTRYSIALVPAFSLILAWVLVFTAQFTDYSSGQKDEHNPLLGRKSLLQEFAS